MSRFKDLDYRNVTAGIASGLLAITGPPALVLEAAANGNFTTTQTILWMFAVYVFGGIFGIVIPLYYRMPIVGAHSITGVAFLATVTAQFSLQRVTRVLGEPTKDLLDAWADSVKAQAYTASLLVHGNTGAYIYEKYNEYVIELGYDKETRIHAHGQGYDLMERPGIRGEDPMPIQLNMNIAIHPTFAKNGAYISCTDNFLVTENGPKRLHKFPQEIIISG